MGRLNHSSLFKTGLRRSILHIQNKKIAGFIDGVPVYLPFGADINDFDDWIPEEWGGPVITAVMRTSVVESEGRPETMGTDTKHVLRDAGVDVHVIGKGQAYAEDANLNDTVLLTARKLGEGIAIAEEDMDDTQGLVSIVQQKQVSWGTSYAKAFDNASLAVTGAESATPSDDRPFTSIYRLVRTTDAPLGYTADDNYTPAPSGVTYDLLNTAFELYETGDYFDEGETIVVASPGFRRVLRGIKDDQNQPIFVRGQGGDSGTPDTLFGYRIRWSQGCRTSAAMTRQPGGNRLMVIGNRQLLVVGRRSGPETRQIPANISREDEAFLKMRARRGFAGGHPAAFSVIEDTENA